MSNISAIDSNFKVETTLQEQDLRFYDVRQSPFQVYGVFYEDGLFRRIPEKVARSVSEGVHSLHIHTAGGRVRFKTDSPYVAIHAKMPVISRMPHFPMTGSSGFDLYADGRYVNTFVPPFEEFEGGYESVRYFPTAQMHEVTINFPLYSAVSELYIGLQEGAAVCAPEPYEIETPIVYYGSSITQGGCASRPGNAYESTISARLNADYLNLGFSGSAKGEQEMADYISGLQMSAFVYDYDHNAPSLQHLADTHENMFECIRRAQPDVPIILMSRPKFYLTEEELARLEVIKATYDHAVERGDKNVWLLDGKKLMELAGNEGTVDNCHPNDLGFASMSKAVGDLLSKILLEKEHHYGQSTF